MRVENLEKCVYGATMALNTVEAFEKFIDFCGKGNIFRLNAQNLLAVYAQKSEATLVTGFDGWKKMGRYPLQNTGIAVYPYQTEGIFSNYSDFVFDISDTRGREIHPWTMTDVIMDRLFESYKEIYGKDSAGERTTFFRHMFYSDITKYALSYNEELWFGEDIEKRWHIHTFMAECCLKIFYTRCGIEYFLDENAKNIFNYYFIREDGSVRASLLTNCIVGIQRIVTNELQYVGKYVIEEKRRMRNGQRIVNGNDGRGTNVDKGGNGAAAPSVSEYVGGGSLAGTGNTTSGGLPGNGTDIKQPASMGENNSGISFDRLLRADADSDEQRRVGENSGHESGRSEEAVRDNAEQPSEEGEAVGNGYPDENLQRESNPKSNHGDNQQGNILPTTDNLAVSGDNGQIDIFSYLVSKGEELAAAGHLDMSEYSDFPKTSFKSPFSNEVIEKILAFGPAGYELRGKFAVFNYYSTHWSDIVVEDAVALIKRKYAGASLGFHIDGRDVSAYYDEEKGLLLSYGKESRLHPALVLSWEDIEERIYKMIEGSRFLDATEEVLAAYQDEESVITDVMGFFFDGFKLEREELPELLRTTGYFSSEAENAIRECITNPAKGQELLLFASELWEKYERGEVERKWKFGCSKGRVEHLSAFLKGRHSFKLQERVDSFVPTFVPEDAVDMVSHLTDKSKTGINFRRQLFEVSEEGGNIKALASWLKNYFGNGGHGYSGYDENHSSKGISIKIEIDNKGGVIENTFSYNVIAQRICTFIRAERMFLEGEEESYPQWKQDKDERAEAEQAFHKELIQERERLPREGASDFPDYTYLTDSEHTELREKLAETLLGNELVKEAYVEISEKMLSADVSLTDKEAFIHDFFRNKEGKTFRLKGNDYCRYGITHSFNTKFGDKALNCNCFPSNYIDTKGWSGTNNYLSISFEELTAAFIAVIGRRSIEQRSLVVSGLEIASTEVAADDAQLDESLIVSKDTYEFAFDDSWTATVGNSSTRGKVNIRAIETLKVIETENRPATEQEQGILSHYLGWGGLPEWFDESKGNYETLHSLLTEEEYKAARSTVTDSFYTPRVVMDGIYKALEQFGFQGGNILEPSMGIGNFYSAMPGNIRSQSRLYGVEIDSISGRIAKLLHPNCNIQICGIENAYLPQNFFDCIIGNVPFGEYKVNDNKFNKYNFMIHDFYHSFRFAQGTNKL